MVNGIVKFKEAFQGFENQYVIIGGTACDLIMENEELPFRATKDIDIVLIIEAVTAEFGRRFWEYVKEQRKCTVLPFFCSKKQGVPIYDRAFFKESEFYRVARRCNSYPAPDRR